jgi:hypothetical protein
VEATGNDKNSSLLRTIVSDCFRPIIFQVTKNDLNYVKKTFSAKMKFEPKF